MVTLTLLPLDFRAGIGMFRLMLVYSGLNKESNERVLRQFCRVHIRKFHSTADVPVNLKNKN